MSLDQTEVEPKAIGEKMRDIRALASHPGWAMQMQPMLADLEREHTEAAIDPGKSPEERAEHIQAIQVIRKIRSYPTDRESQLEASWKLQQAKRPTA